MKPFLTITFTLINVFLFSQEIMNSQLNKLFQNLNLKENVSSMIKNSELKFEYGKNQGIEWTGGDTKIYSSVFNRNELIQSKILNGQIFIKQNEFESKNNIYEITERIVFENEETLLYEFSKLNQIFEEYAYKIKESRTEVSETFETLSQTNQFLIKNDSKISDLTFAYILPNEQIKDYYLIIIYKNKILKK